MCLVVHFDSKSLITHLERDDGSSDKDETSTVDWLTGWHVVVNVYLHASHIYPVTGYCLQLAMPINAMDCCQV